ncbi:MAG: F0F1 ATP synthase subunit gamma [Bacteroidales bacterium]|nr:F0F1 ATP synthase subunit gamma [Bacteroidales bacterium]MCM1147369.1 F0F1 ATP synthase subunit gamma [Bacteroidales bacterium]MCM1207196.1 F0F1 ATP synthase subunit gamma [Bacillota bacterium]MCM1510429.1 F0F1 ATP synthase subunit gamma [Clostridium sp.]
MASLKEIKDRIASINSTRKITSAMKMVASSKLHHAQVMIENMLPYERMLEHILKTFLASEVDAKTIYSEERPVNKVAIIAYSSNSSLCGGFNANVIKALQKAVDDYKELGLENIVVYPVGRKIAEKAVKLGLPVAGDFNNLCDHPDISGCVAIAKDVATKFSKGEVDKVELIYHHFKSAGSQVLKRKTYLPIDIKEVDFNEEKARDLKTQIATKETQEYIARHAREEAEKADENIVPLNDNFIVEPDLYTVLRRLIPQYLHLKVYTSLLDSNASEHAARMVAMQTATDNADELLRVLNLQYNKSRQQAITNELLDLAGGSQN